MRVTHTHRLVLAAALTLAAAPALGAEALLTADPSVAVGVDALTGRFDLGGLPLSAAVSATGAPVVLPVGSALRVEGVSLTGASVDLAAGPMSVRVPPQLIELPGHMGVSTQVDARGKKVQVQTPASLVVEVAGGTLRPAERGAPAGAMALDLSGVVVEVLPEGSTAAPAEQFSLNYESHVASPSLMTTGILEIAILPDIAEGNSGCMLTETLLCVCGDAPGCSQVIAACFGDAEATGSWDCLSYDDEGQCILGTCTW